MQNMFKISGNEQNFPEFQQFHELGNEFLPFAQKKLGFNKPVSVNLVSDPENAKDPLGKTAYYDPNMMKITLFIDKRHVKDILRSLSHELVHHTQNCRGEFNGVDLGEGTFTTNKALQELELKAYAEGNGRLVREFEEYMKSKQDMNESSSYLLRQNISKENNIMSIQEQEKTDGKAVPADDRCYVEPGSEGYSYKSKWYAHKDCLPDWDDDSKCMRPTKNKCVDVPQMSRRPKKGEVPGRPPIKEETNENWFKGNKDQLLFERLVKKWTK